MPKTATTVRTSRQTSTELSGPASLVNVEARNLTKCRICGSERVTVDRDDADGRLAGALRLVPPLREPLVASGWGDS